MNIPLRYDREFMQVSLVVLESLEDLNTLVTQRSSQRCILLIRYLVHLPPRMQSGFIFGAQWDPGQTGTVRRSLSAGIGRVCACVC